MARKPHVSVGGHDVDVGPGAGGKHSLIATAPISRAGAGPPAGTAVHYSLKIKPDHPNVHLKTKAHWIIGTIPQPDKEGPKRTFIAGRRWVSNGFVRYWGFVKFDGKKHYGWVDGLHFENHKGKAKQKAGSYSAYRSRVRKLIRRAWRYRSRAHHKIPVKAFLTTDAPELKFYNNPIENDAYVVKTVKKQKNAKGFSFAIRYASGTWMLVHHGSGHTWYFIKASLKDLEINYGLRSRDRETQKMTSRSIPRAWA